MRSFAPSGFPQYTSFRTVWTGISSQFSVEVPAVFKVLLLTYEIFNCASQSYLAELLNPHMSTRSLHSQGTGSLIVPKVKEAALSDRTLLPHAPAKWRSVLCTADSQVQVRVPILFVIAGLHPSLFPDVLFCFY